MTKSEGCPTPGECPVLGIARRKEQLRRVLFGEGRLGDLILKGRDPSIYINNEDDLSAEDKELMGNIVGAVDGMVVDVFEGGAKVLDLMPSLDSDTARKTCHQGVVLKALSNGEVGVFCGAPNINDLPDQPYTRP